MSSYCEVCKRDDADYLDPTAKMWYSKRCPHSLCNGCVTSAFANRSTAMKCPPPCGVTLTKADLSKETNEEREFEREKLERAKLSLVYNQRREDFATREEWHGYCEGVEALVAALVAGSEGERKEAERAVEEYRRGHAEAINRASARRTAEESTALVVEREDANARKAAAAAAAEEAAARARVDQEVHRFKQSLAFGEADGGGASSVAGLLALKEKLACIKAKRAAEAAALKALPPPPPPPPCPHVALPKVSGFKNKAWGVGGSSAIIPPKKLPRDSLKGHWRAVGFNPLLVLEMEQEEVSELFL